MHVYAWSALVILIFQFFTDNLTVNPIQALEQRTGRHAITLLVLSLACTPLNTLFKWPELLKRRRALGLYAFMYATIHVLIYLDLDYGLAWSFIMQDVIEKPRLIVGAIAFLLAHPAGMDLLRHLEETPRQKMEAPAPDRVCDRAHGRAALRLEQKRRPVRPAGRDRPPADLWIDRGAVPGHAHPAGEEGTVVSAGPNHGSVSEKERQFRSIRLIGCKGRPDGPPLTFKICP
jgi:hypothetical protein